MPDDRVELDFSDPIHEHLVDAGYLVRGSITRHAYLSAKGEAVLALLTAADEERLLLPPNLPVGPPVK